MSKSPSGIVAQARARRVWWPALLWAAVIFVTSTRVITTGQLADGVQAVTGGRVRAEEFSLIWKAIWWFFVKGWHAVEFGMLAWFLGRILRQPMAAGAALLFACSDEFHQYFVPHRGARLSDVAIDALGVLLVMVWPKTIHLSQKMGLGAAIVTLIYLCAFHPFGTFGDGFI